MTKTAVKVFVRERPTAQSFEGLKVHQEASTISIRVPKAESDGLINNNKEEFSFKVCQDF